MIDRYIKFKRGKIKKSAVIGVFVELRQSQSAEV